MPHKVESPPALQKPDGYSCFTDMSYKKQTKVMHFSFKAYGTCNYNWFLPRDYKAA